MIAPGDHWILIRCAAHHPTRSVPLNFRSVIRRGLFVNFLHIPLGGLTTANNRAILFYKKKSRDEDTLFRQGPQRERHLVQGVWISAGEDTTSELSGGNAGTGAPVTASMSDGCGRNQGGTVEYFVSHP